VLGAKRDAFRRIEADGILPRLRFVRQPRDQDSRFRRSSARAAAPLDGQAAQKRAAICGAASSCSRATASTLSRITRTSSVT
jgi:hypothetical protein